MKDPMPQGRSTVSHEWTTREEAMVVVGLAFHRWALLEREASFALFVRCVLRCSRTVM